jgi:transcriptional regulator GlxA family with amidase domain
MPPTIASAARAAPGAEPVEAPARRFVFLLAPRFSLIALACALEPLRIANRLANRRHYAWRLATEGGGAATCSGGAQVAADCGLEDVGRDATIVVCGGVDVHLAATRPVLTWLRRQARVGARLGAVCTGSYLLARAGLLEGRRCTIHWENRAALAEEFPDLDITGRVFEIDDDRMTCAGGAAGADMMLDLIAREHGPELSGLVAEQMILPPARSGAEEQRLSAPARIGVRHPRLVAVVQRMEAAIEEPASPADLAAEAGMSTRQLERLFRRYLNRSPKRYYMDLRLQKARGLLLQTDMSVINVALACGFTSPSHFSKCYRARYGRTPYRERGAPEGTGA